jgi:predicted flap endonuclease-1-like 5' DNA nuclease
MRANVAKALDRICCGTNRDTGTGPVRDPGRFTNFNLAMFAEDFKLVNTFLDQPEKLPSDFTTKVAVNSLGAEQARTVLRGTGIEVAETVDINDAKAFDIIQSKLAGVNATDILYSAGEVRPGDKVALLVQDGIARGYVLLERGTGKLPFDRATLAGVVTDADKTGADKLVRDVAVARDDIAVLSKTREALVTGIGGLREEIAALAKERDVTVNSLADARGQLDALARTRETLAEQIESARKDLQSAEESRRTMTQSLRNAQPVNVVVGNKPDVIAKLAGEGITTLGDIAQMTPAVIKRLERAGIQTEAELTEARNKATEFLRRG